MYVSIGSNLASALDDSTEVYHHLSYSLRCGIRPVSRHATWSWKPPRNRPMQGVTTHVSAPKRNTNCKAALNKNTDTHGLTPSLLRILIIFLQTARDFFRLRITASQSSSAANNILPKYLKEGTIYPPPVLKVNVCAYLSSYWLISSTMVSM